MEESHTELQSSYEDFLRVERFNQVERISSAVDAFERIRNEKHNKRQVCPRVKIFLQELRSDNPQLAQRLRNDPLRHIRALEWACHSIASEERPGYDIKSGSSRIEVSLSGPVGASPVSPRGLTSQQLNKLVCVEGIATKISSVKFKLNTSVHYCPTTQRHDSRQYVDVSDSQLGLPALDSSGKELPDRFVTITSSVYPTTDKENNPLQTEYGLSLYSDVQTICLQEMPESAPMGQLPRSIDLLLRQDLVDTAHPGDRIKVIGIYTATPKPSSTGLFQTHILANSLETLSRDVPLNFIVSDVRNIRQLGREKEILSILGRSFAPFLHGHSIVKKALILQLLSGCEKNLPNGTHLRGDINVLLLGDPSTAKSQLLRTALNLAPLAISTTGKGSSGVGLTAAVTSDPETRERRLEAGAMVLADRGVVCIDEFDKMSELDRVAIHEVMEQQTVTIAKAGIHATLNARCSVLAAANPVYGTYDKSKSLQENIGLPDSLLSRFDLLFIFIDNLDVVKDRTIASHVVRGHRSGISPVEEDDEPEVDHTIWQNTFLNGDHQQVLKHDFLRKYIHFAKARYKPKLTQEAREAIAIQYAQLRSSYNHRTLPITVRSLETLIRLSSAHAKARLSNIVEPHPDVAVASDILSFALYHEDNENVNEENQYLENDQNVNEVTQNSDEEQDQPNLKKPRTEEVNQSIIKQRIYSLIAANNEEIPSKDIFDNLSEIPRKDINEALIELEEESKVMIQDDLVLII